jgi:regulator of RNase E activity RraA
MEDLVTRLNRLDTCAVSDAMDKLGLRGVVTGIHQYSTQRKIAGPVLTVKLGIDDGRPTAAKHLSTTAIEMANPGTSSSSSSAGMTRRRAQPSLERSVALPASF